MTTELAGIAAVIIVITCLLARYYFVHLAQGNKGLETDPGELPS